MVAEKAKAILGGALCEFTENAEDVSFGHPAQLCGLGMANGQRSAFGAYLIA